MKKALFKLLFGAGLFIAANFAHAGLFGYTTTVQATDGSNNFVQRISSGTYDSCEYQRQIVISGWESSGYIITSNPSCVAVAMGPLIDPDKFRVINWIDEIEWPRPWPWPVCLSCPYLVPDVIDRIYPETAGKVKDLIDSYGIDQYNLEVQKGTSINSEIGRRSFPISFFPISSYELSGNHRIITDQHR